MFLVEMSTRSVLTTIFFVILLNFSFGADSNEYDDLSLEEEDAFNNGYTVPGTKWCGPGNTADNFDDLGRTLDLDICCRSHDHCDDAIESKQTRHDLHNPGLLPRFNCDCEQEFFNCLKDLSGRKARAIGKIYFSVRSKCFRLEHPIVGCARRYKGIIRRRCLEYSYDTTKPKIWQWFDNPYFRVEHNHSRYNHDDHHHHYHQ